MARLPDRQRWIGTTLAVAVALAACVRAVTSEPPQPGTTLDEAARREVFSQLAGREPAQRARAARNFRGDAWSQDDDFHAGEMQTARRIARTRRVSLGDVLRAFDDGMRQGWPVPDGVELKVTVAPCRPRPVY